MDKIYGSLRSTNRKVVSFSYFRTKYVYTRQKNFKNFAILTFQQSKIIEEF